MHVPFLLPEDQAYYWTHYWQEAEAEALAELQGGEFLTFDSTDPGDLARWLLSDDAE
jgi:hypothetical protein